jgi:hypothetical protein
MNRHKAIAVRTMVVAAVAVALVTAVAVAGAAVNSQLGARMAPGMMGGAFGGYGGGGAGTSGTSTPSSAQLKHVAAQINLWLTESGFKGFRVAEVMAFTNNDYVAVHDQQGMPAFELLTNLRTNWVMEEPPSMMWNTRYGGWASSAAD